MDQSQVNISFHDLSCSVRVRPFSRTKKQVLSNLNGVFRAGNLTAITGPSGAGKSTLMNILSGFTTSGVSGNVSVNGVQRNLADFHQSSVYIMQEDNLQPVLTVLETMHFAVDLKFKANSGNRQKVQTILKEMGLESVQHTLTRNLSGGQKKRLAIALELIRNPRIIFLDEPISGLDSVSANQCFELLKSLARGGRTVICILHQPSNKIFEMIDLLYVVGSGQCVYNGSPKNMVTHLASLGFHCPTYHNPSDYLLEVVSGEYGDHTAELVNAIARTNKRKSLPEILSDKNTEIVFYTNSPLNQILTLTRYNIIKLSRDKILAYLRLSVSSLIGLLAGIVFYGIGQDAAYSFDNFNMLFFTVLFLTFLSMNTTLVAFPLELPVLRREYFNRWYSLHSFYLANRIADLPIQLLASFVYLAVIYFMSGQLIEYQRLGMFLLSSLLVSLVAQMVGLIVGASFSVQSAPVVGPMVLVPTMVFSGFFVHLNHAHPSLQWFFHMSFCKYGFDGVMYATYGMDRPRLKCSAEYCQFSSPKLILNEFGAKHLDYWFAVSVLAGTYVFLNFIAYFALKMKLKLQKR